jgi:hypothetical protein
MIATILIGASGIFGALIALAIIGAFIWHYMVTRERELTELDSSLDPRIVGDVTKPHSALIRYMPQRTEV